jgi:nucleoside diphosphate kinase
VASVRGSNARAEVKSLGLSAIDSVTYEATFSAPLAPVLDGNTTLCIVKPHAVREGNTGAILSLLDSGSFDIRTLTSRQLSVSEAEEFYQVYKGVVSEYKEMVVELASSVSLVMEVSCRERADPQQALRALAGPWGEASLDACSRLPCTAQTPASTPLAHPRTPRSLDSLTQTRQTRR